MATLYVHPDSVETDYAPGGFQSFHIIAIEGEIKATLFLSESQAEEIALGLAAKLKAAAPCPTCGAKGGA